MAAAAAAAAAPPCRVRCDAYRLGDFVSGYWAAHDGARRNRTLVAHACGRWPASVACCHARGGDVCACVGGGGGGGYLAVHLRLGDVLDWPHYREARGCARAAAAAAPSGGCHYVRPLAFYRAVALPPRGTPTRVVGNVHYRQVAANGSRHSAAYRAAVVGILAARGMDVQQTEPRDDPPPWWWLGGAAEEAAAADADLRTLVGATWLVPARGGFGALAARCARGAVLLAAA